MPQVVTEDVYSVQQLIPRRRVASQFGELSGKAVITFTEFIDGFLLIALAHQEVNVLFLGVIQIPEDSLTLNAE